MITSSGFGLKIRIFVIYMKGLEVESCMQHYQSKVASTFNILQVTQRSWVQHVKTIAGNLIHCHTVQITTKIQHLAESYGNQTLKVVGPLLKIRKQKPNTYS